MRGWIHRILLVAALRAEGRVQHCALFVRTIAIPVRKLRLVVGDSPKATSAMKITTTDLLNGISKRIFWSGT